MAANHEHNDKAISGAQHGPAIEVEKPSDKHEEYVVDAEGKAVRIDYSGAHKKTDPEEIKYVPLWGSMRTRLIEAETDYSLYLGLSRSLIDGLCQHYGSCIGSTIWTEMQLH